MQAFLNAIQFVSGPLTLVAFLAVVFLAIFRRSVKDKRGLEYIYNLFKEKLTREQFYHLALHIVGRAFWAFIIVFVVSMSAFVFLKWGEGNKTNQTIYGDMISGGSGDDIVITSDGGAAFNRPMPKLQESDGQMVGGNILDGGSGDDIIISGDGNTPLSIPNSGKRADKTLRATAAYRIDVIAGERTTDIIRQAYRLRAISSNEEEKVVQDLPNGIYGFTVPWIIGRMDLNTDNWSSTPGGAVTQEVHKRPSGIFAVVGFLSAEHAAILAKPDRDQPVDVQLYPNPQQNADNVASIPVPRIESITLGRMQDFGEESIEMTVW